MRFQVLFGVLGYVAFLGSFCQAQYHEKTHEDFYKNCNGGVPGITCTGIPEECVAKKDCLYGVAFWEDETHFWGKIITPDHFEPYVVVLGYLPFEKQGSNLTAKCKPKLELSDFRIILYKLSPLEIPDKEGQLNIWSSGEQGFGKDENAWGHNCDYKFKEANGFYSDETDERFIILGGEYVHLEYAGYPDDKDPRQGKLPGFTDAAQFRSKDGITYTNF